jgi:hypothetical protein
MVHEKATVRARARRTLHALLGKQIHPNLSYVWVPRETKGSIRVHSIESSRPPFRTEGRWAGDEPLALEVF